MITTGTKYLPYSKLKTTKKQKKKFYNNLVILDQYMIFICIFLLFIFIVHKPIAYIVFNTCTQHVHILSHNINLKFISLVSSLSVGSA